MTERITFVCGPEFKKAIDAYVIDHNITMSGLIKGAVSEKLIKEKYIKNIGGNKIE